MPLCRIKYSCWVSYERVTMRIPIVTWFLKKIERPSGAQHYYIMRASYVKRNAPLTARSPNAAKVLLTPTVLSYTWYLSAVSDITSSGNDLWRISSYVDNGPYLGPTYRLTIPLISWIISLHQNLLASPRHFLSRAFAVVARGDVGRFSCSRQLIFGT